MPCIALKPGQFRRFARSIGVLERKCEALPRAFGNDYPDNIGIGGTVGGKTYLHLETAFQQLGCNVRGTRPVLYLGTAISKHSGRIKAKDGCGNQGLASMGLLKERKAALDRARLQR